MEVFLVSGLRFRMRPDTQSLVYSTAMFGACSTSPWESRLFETLVTFSSVPKVWTWVFIELWIVMACLGPNFGLFRVGKRWWEGLLACDWLTEKILPFDWLRGSPTRPRPGFSMKIDGFRGPTFRHAFLSWRSIVQSGRSTRSCSEPSRPFWAYRIRPPRSSGRKCPRRRPENIFDKKKWNYNFTFAQVSAAAR